MNDLLIDVREYPEYAAGHIAGSKLVPLGTLEAESTKWAKTSQITLVCESGRRAEQARGELAATGFEHLTVLEGGVQAWRAAGKPLSVAEHRPWSMERQVRVGAGSLVVAFVALGTARSRYFLVGAAVVGVGLIFAGVSNFCMMGLLLGRMPWNRGSKVTA